MSGVQLAQCLLAAGLLLVAYQFIILAMRTGDVSFIAPFRYTSLVFSIGLGFVLFGEVPDVFMIIGSALVIVSGLYTLHRERLTHAARKAEAKTQSS